jgi:UDP-N-acetylglucosamine diphosphorylase/glucosamine-1-phosphate N-acetyltransferase
MVRYILFEDQNSADLLPLVLWRSVFELNGGRICQMDRIARRLGQHPSGLWAREWIAKVAAHRCQLPVNQPVDGQCVLVNGRWSARRNLDIQAAPSAGVCGDSLVYVALDDAFARRWSPETLLGEDRWREALSGVPTHEIDVGLFRYPWDFVTRNADVLRRDWSTADCAIDGTVSTSAFLLRPDAIHVGEGSVIKPCAVLDAEQGPIYVSCNVTVEPHACISGPAYIGPGTIIKPHAVISGGTSIGPACRIGGEVNQCIISGYTHKEHEGYLGRSYVGNWVDIGPGTANTDIKSTYGHIRVWYGSRTLDTGLSACGAVIADHVRIGTNQKIPNGAVIGFAASAASGQFLPKFLPSFGWFTDSGLSSGDPERLLATARLAMASRNVDLSDMEAELFRLLPSLAARFEEQDIRSGPTPPVLE